MLTAMGKRITAVAGTALLAVALMGCAGTAEADPTPTPTKSVNANLAACGDAAAASLTIAQVLNSEDAVDQWGDLKITFDEIALRAEGDVKDRLSTLVEDWPEASGLIVWHEFDDLNDMLLSIERACDADDAAVDIGQVDG